MEYLWERLLLYQSHTKWISDLGKVRERKLFHNDNDGNSPRRHSNPEHVCTLQRTIPREKQNRIESIDEADESTAGDVSIPLAVIDTWSRQIITKIRAELNSIIDHLNLIDSYGVFHSATEEISLLQCTRNIQQDKPHPVVQSRIWIIQKDRQPYEHMELN